MPHLIAPARLPLPPSIRVVFLAGSIEMGHAEPWQDELATRLLAANPGLVVANPRRSAWDPSWEQSIDNPNFAEQVNWELDHLARADLVVFYFQPGTQSPITLLELGKHLERPDISHSTLVCCPPGFWRRGNVEIVMARAGLGRPLDSLDELTAQALDRTRD